jgi:hypothetical protein
MLTPTAIDLSTTTLSTDGFAIDDSIVTVQAAYAGVDGDFDIIPLQTNDDTNYNPIYDSEGKSIIWRVRPGVETSGNVTFNIPAELFALKLKLECSPVSGKFGATVGTVTFTIKNTIDES